MSRWSKLFEDKVRPEFKDQLFAKADKELEQLAADGATSSRRAFWQTLLPWATGAFTLGAAALVWVKRANQDEKTFNAEFAEFIVNDEDIDFDMIDDLEMLEELEDLDKNTNG